MASGLEEFGEEVMATEEEVPVTKGSVEEKLGDLKIDEAEKFEDSSETPVTETPEAKEAVLEELTESPPELHHVETKDTTDPVSESPTEGDVVKAEVPEAFAEELKSDHNIVSSPATEETPTSTVESVATETGPAAEGESAPATREVPVEVTHEEVAKKPSKISSIGEKISTTLHKIVGKD